MHDWLCLPVIMLPLWQHICDMPISAPRLRYVHASPNYDACAAHVLVVALLFR